MIVINAKFSIKPEKRNEFLAEVSELVASTRKEDGCLSYQLYESIDMKMNLSWLKIGVIKQRLKDTIKVRYFNNYLKI